MPTLDPKLTQTEHLKPLTAAPTGQNVLIDRNILNEVYQRLNEAIAAVWRGNTRIDGIKLERYCTKAQLETGKLPSDCPKSTSN